MNYIKQNFIKGQILKADHMNHIEDGIEALSEEIEKVAEYFDVVEYVNGKNLFNIEAIEYGFIKEDGAIAPKPDGSYITSDYMRVVPGKKLAASYYSPSYAKRTTMMMRFAMFYNIDKSILSYDTSNKDVLVAPDGAAYVRVSLSMTGGYAGAQEIQIELTDTGNITSYEPYGVVETSAALASDIIVPEVKDARGEYATLSDRLNSFAQTTHIKNGYSIQVSAEWTAEEENHDIAECGSLKNLDTSDWDVSGATDMSFMFYGCSSLKEIDVSNWDVSKVTNFDHFAAHAGLVRKGIEKWDTSSATNMNAMFHNCAEEELDLSGYDTSKVQFFSQMFENSPNLKRIKGMDKWNTSNATGFDEMFGRCYALEELDLSSFDTSKACNGVQASTNGHTTGTFRNFCNDCRNLKWIKLGPKFAINGDGTNTTAEYKLVLPTPDSAYIDGADGLWYVLNGDSFAPTEIPDRAANTYYSSYRGVADTDVIVKNGSLIETAKAIREINGGTDKYTPSNFAEWIRRELHEFKINNGLSTADPINLFTYGTRTDYFYRTGTPVDDSNYPAFSVNASEGYVRAQDSAGNSAAYFKNDKFYNDGSEFTISANFVNETDGNTASSRLLINMNDLNGNVYSSDVPGLTYVDSYKAHMVDATSYTFTLPEDVNYFHIGFVFNSVENNTDYIRIYDIRLTKV